MTAEAEVCNGPVSAIDEKSEFKPELNGIGNHDRAADPEDSYVFVNDTKDMASVDGSSRSEPSAPVELFGIESDARNRNPEGEDVGKNGSTEGKDGNLSLVNGSPDVQSTSIVDGGGDQDTVEDDNKCLEEWSDQNGKADDVNGEVDRMLTEAETKYTASTGEIPSVSNGVLAGEEGSVRDEDEIRDKLAISKPEWKAESEIKKAEGSNGKIRRSEEVEVATFEDQNGKIGVVAEAEVDTVEDQLVSEASPGVEENQVARVPNLRLVAESEQEEEPKSSLSHFDKLVTLEDVAELALGKEAVQDKKCDIDPENDVHHGLDKDKVVESNADCNVKMASDEVLEGKDGGIFSVPHVEGSTYPVEEPGSSISEEEPKSSLSPFDKQETVEDVAELASSTESALGNEAMQDQNCYIDPEYDIQRGMDKEKVVESNADCNVSMARDEDREGKDEGIFSGSLVEGSMYPEEEPKSSLSEEEEEPKSSLSPFDKQETVEDVAESASSAESASANEAMQDQKCDIDPDNDVQRGLDKNKVVERHADYNLRMASDKVLEGKGEGTFSVSHVEGCTYTEEEPKSVLPPVDKLDTVEDVAESFVGKEAMQGQECDTDPENAVQQRLDKEKVVTSNTDCNVRMASEEVLEGKDEGLFSLSHVEGSKTYPEEEPKSSLSVKEEELSDVAEFTLGKEAMPDQKCDTDPENDVQHGLDKDKVVEINADFDVRMASNQVLEGKDEGIFSVPCVEGSITYPEDSGNGASPQISVSESEAEASEPTQKISASSAQVHRPADEVQISDAETSELISSLPVDGSESESFGNEHIHLDSLETSTINGVCSGSDRMVVSNEREPISQGSELSTDFEDDNNPSEAHNSSAVNHIGFTSEIDTTRGSEVLDSFVSDKGVSNSMLESEDVKEVAGGATGSDDGNLLLAKKGDTANSRSVDVSMASLESSSEKVTETNVSAVAVTKPFNIFVRMPRYSDEKLQEQIRIAELEVNEKTKLRDSIQAQIQEKRAKNQKNGIDYEYARGEDRSLKKLLKEKRMEIDSLQSVINKAKNATSIEDLNSRIKTIEHMIQHETLPLKEEKQLIHEIKQLKQLREQLSSSKCSYDEIQQALGQREQAEERLKTVRKELGNLKDTASKAQTACDEAESKYNIEHQKVKELQAQFRAADEVRQVAYAKFLHLSKELSLKRKNFFKFKNDGATATNSASFTDDRKIVFHHYVNEVENFMELWNGNDEFRSEYVRLNTRSTLRRFGTLDGRSLGPDEKPPIIPSYVRERNDKVVTVPANADSISRSPAMELKPETKIDNVSLDINLSKKETESKEKRVTTEGPDQSKQVNSLATVSGMEENVEVREELMKTKEELELIRIAEEVRREEAEAKLKEQRRLEEIVKAKEARERKQRRDEKAQKREELKARKEAEQKEKEREKKSRKKERKKAVNTSTSCFTDLQDDASSITSVEISEEASAQVNDISTKKPKTSRVMVSKQKKTRSAPPPSLRNRNRRKWQQWMWVSLVSFVVLVLFWLGNMGVFSSVNSKLQGAGF